MERRNFLKSLGALSASAPFAFPHPFFPSSEQEPFPEADREDLQRGDFTRVREDFPHTRQITWLNNASSHPMGFYSVNALRRYIDWRHNEHRDHWMLWNSDEREEAKALFAGLIGAFPDEIAFARSTMDADIVQAAGAIPIDVRQMGIDMAACSTYKFLMGSPGFGFLYIRKELQGYDSPVPPDRHDSHQGGMQKYEVGFPSPYGFVCARESLRYIRTLGVDRIRRHVRSLTDRLAAELPALGYPTVTPSGTDSPIITFLCDDPEEVRRRLLSRDIQVAVYGNGRFRVSPSVFNNREDIDRLLEALS